jgi:GntR family transcriptional regulator
VIVTVDPRSPTPPFEQLRVGIRQLVATGALPLGSRLPTVRQLAADLALAPGTVARAIRELEAEGIVETKGRHGTHVKRAPRVSSAAKRDRRLREAAHSYAAIVAELGVDSDDAIEHVRNALTD